MTGDLCTASGGLSFDVMCSVTKPRPTLNINRFVVAKNRVGRRNNKAVLATSAVPEFNFWQNRDTEVQERAFSLSIIHAVKPATATIARPRASDIEISPVW